jgi:hypothetical protein
MLVCLYLRDSIPYVLALLLLLHHSKNGNALNRDSVKDSVNNKNFRKLAAASIDLINEEWENTDKTSMMWQIIKDADFQEFLEVLQEHPELAHIRSEDGRGPMWWAHEYGRPQMVGVLRQLGVREDRTDAKGIKPTDISHSRINGNV